MAFTITTRGSGTVANNSISSDTFPESTFEKTHYVGIECHLTATPAAGWAFDHWEWEYDYERTVYSSGTTTSAHYSTVGAAAEDTPHIGDNPLNAPTGYAAGPASGMSVGNPTWWPLELEMSHYWRSSTADDWSLTYYTRLYNVSVTAVFVQSHVPTHLIIRDDTTGKIMRGGTANLILRDD